MKKILYTALGAIMLTACQKEATDLPIGNYPEDGIVRIATQVNAPLTRATTSNYKGRNLSLSIVPNSNNATYTYNNINWTTADNGTTWTPASQMLWEGANKLVNIHAYAPYVDGATDITIVPFAVETDQATKGTLSSDLMGFTQSAFNPYDQLSAKQAIPIVFDHILSKLTLTLTFGDQFDGQNVTISSVKLIGTNTAMVYNAKDKTVAAAASAVIAPISMMKVEGSNNSYTAILAPQSVAAGASMIDVTLSNGSIYRYTAATGGHTFATGTAYTMNLKIGKDKITIDGNVAVTDWGTDTNNPFEGGGEAIPIINITSLSAAEITEDLIASYINRDGNLIVKGTHDEAKLDKICAYVRAGASIATPVVHLDLTGMVGLVDLIFNLEFNLKFGKDMNSPNTSLITAKLPTTVTQVNQTFAYCSSLTSVTGLDNVINADRAFMDCTSLTKAPYMPMLTTIMLTFNGSAITEFVNDKITAISGANSFTSCSELTKIDCPNAKELHTQLFRGDCNKLTEIRFTAEVFTKVRSYSITDYGTTEHHDPFTSFVSKANATIYLNANQETKITVNGTDCTWTPYEINTTDLKEPVILTGFKAVYCGSKQVYPALP